MSQQPENSSKHLNVAQALRQRVIEGKCPPGSRLPTQRTLSREFGLSPVTMQKATRQLVAEGFLRSSRRHGMFVSDNPPNLCRYALAFPSRSDGVQYWTDFWTTLRTAAISVIQSEPPKQLDCFYDITGHADVEDYQRLLGDVQAQRLAGIILLTPPHLILDTPLADDCGVPRVYLGRNVPSWNVPSVTTDYDMFINRALDFAGAQARRRPALIGMGFTDGVIPDGWSRACTRNGMEQPRWQLLSVPLMPANAARHVTQVLMLLPPEHRPDTLVVADDHFVEEVTAGLLASHLPEDQFPLVIAHTNFPKISKALVPVTYLGFDLQQIIRACIDVLDMQRLGNEPPRMTLIPPVFASARSSLSATLELEHANVLKGFI